MMNILIGKVTQIDEAKGSVRALFPSKNNQVSNWLPVLTSCISFPQINDTVCVLYTDAGIGICAGTFFNSCITPEFPIKITRELVSTENITTEKAVKATGFTGEFSP